MTFSKKSLWLYSDVYQYHSWHGTNVVNYKNCKLWIFFWFYYQIPENWDEIYKLYENDPKIYPSWNDLKHFFTSILYISVLISAIKISNICYDVDVIVGFQKCVTKLSKNKRPTKPLVSFLYTFCLASSQFVLAWMVINKTQWREIV